MDLFSENVPRPEKEKPRVLRVGELTRLLKDCLEDRFPNVWVQGEISNVTKHTSGHIYFTLKDALAQIKCVIWRSALPDVGYEPEDGGHVVVRGRITLFEKGGYYQIAVTRLQPEGLGELQLAFERLKKKLLAEGLFDASRKKAIPETIERVGIVTSSSGAAIRDIQSVVHRRMPWVELILRPVSVQGESAAIEIAQAIREFNEHRYVQVLIIGRGGGSLEDLWCFNSEIVARAIAASIIPTISAVGHEIDFTIADFAADVRAATPSAAAELVTADRQELLFYVENLRERLSSSIEDRIDAYRVKLEQLQNRYAFRRPEQLVAQYRQQSDEWERRLFQTLRHQVAIQNRHVIHLEQQLQMLNPKNTLQRGYAIVRQEERIVQRAASWKEGSPASVEFFDGTKSLE